jgi:hypothetical protein
MATGSINLTTGEITVDGAAPPAPSTPPPEHDARAEAAAIVGGDAQLTSLLSRAASLPLAEIESINDRLANPASRRQAIMDLAGRFGGPATSADDVRRITRAAARGDACAIERLRITPFDVLERAMNS